MSKCSVEALSLALRAEVKQFGVRVVLIEPTGVRKVLQVQLTARPSGADEDPYGEFKHRCAEITCAMAEMPFVSIDADTVARAIVRAVEAKNPKPRYIVGASGKASVLVRLLLTDRMWDRLLMKDLKPVALDVGSAAEQDLANQLDGPRSTMNSMTTAKLSRGKSACTADVRGRLVALLL